VNRRKSFGNYHSLRLLLLKS